jgi:hypothetical protein
MTTTSHFKTLNSSQEKLDKWIVSSGKRLKLRSSTKHQQRRWPVFSTRLDKSFSPRQKGFAYESGCFNIVQALNEVLRAAEVRQDVALVQLGISKAFDTVPHQGFDPTLKRPGIPLEVRSPIINSHKRLTTKCFPVSCPLSCPHSPSSLLATSSGSFI